MWKPILKWSMLVLLLGYVVAMFVWARVQAYNHTCKGIEVVIEGDNRVSSVTPKGVIDVLSGYKEPIVGRPIHTINTYDIARYLRGINSFETVDCMITSLSKLRVTITPMLPAIRVFDGDKSYYVNKDGKTIAAVPGFHVDVPVVSGSFGKKLRPEIVLPLVRYMQNDSLLSGLVSMIYVKDAHNIILVPRYTGHVINFGDTSRIDEKRRALATAYKTILPYRGWNTYDTISVKYKGQIVATRRDKTPLHPEMEIDETDEMEEVSSLAAIDSVAAPKLPHQAN